MSILNQSIVLRLNANYMPIGWSTPADAFVALSGSGKDGMPPAKALDIQYDYDENGNPKLDRMAYFNLYPWNEWIELAEKRKGDLDRTVKTVNKEIRIPTVIVCPQFALMPQKEQKSRNKRAVRERYGNKCAYTGVELTNKTASVDHIIPKSRWKELGKEGSADCWENLVPALKKLNNDKGNRLNEEIGLKLLYKPVAPKKIPLCNTYKRSEASHPDHLHFLTAE